MSQRLRLLLPVGLLLVGAALLWAASQVVWVDVIAFNDQSGATERALTGGNWYPALVPLALGSVAAVAAVSLVRATAARAVGAVIALLGVAAGTLALTSLGEVDTGRAHSVITSAEGLARTDAGPGTGEAESIPQWSRVTDVAVRPVGPAIAGAGALALLGAGVVVMACPARAVARDERYVTPAARREESAAGHGGDTGDIGRDLWQELDEGRDPTG